MRNLCIDWGNSRVKAGIFENDHLLNHYNFSLDNALDDIIQIVTSQEIAQAIICSVVDDTDYIIMQLRVHIPVIVLNDTLNLPVMNAYGGDTLGMDRVALVVGASQIQQNVNHLVISCGSAITYNLLRENTAFRGGAISPGMKMRFRSLHEHTSKLPLVSEEGEWLLIGYDTDTGIRSGVMNGIVGEIDAMIDQYKKQYPNILITITGGNHQMFVGKLKNQIFADANILLKGLNTILKHNAR